jgi:hypothetical protein
MGYFFITKIIPNLLKSDIIVGDIFRVLFEVQMIRQKYFDKLKGDAHEKN